MPGGSMAGLACEKTIEQIDELLRFLDRRAVTATGNFCIAGRRNIVPEFVGKEWRRCLIDGADHDQNRVQNILELIMQGQFR